MYGLYDHYMSSNLYDWKNQNNFKTKFVIALAEEHFESLRAQYILMAQKENEYSEIRR